MSSRDDHLWDPRNAAPGAEPDAALRELEARLRPFAHDGRALDLAALPPQLPAPPRRLPWLLAAAAVLVGAVAAFFSLRDPELHVGTPPRTFTTAQISRTIALGPLVDLTLEPDSELRVEHWQADEALCRLVRGGLIARVAPPPAVQPDFFLVDTALGRVTDKGCRYELRITEDGHNRVRVTEGMVTFARGERTIWVPVGAQATITPKGAGTPLFDLCSKKLREVAGRYDEALWDDRPDARVAAAKNLAIVAQDRRDSLVLWHLLADPDPRVRDIAESALLDLVGEPPDAVPSKDPHHEPAVWLAFLRLGPWMEAK